VSPTTNEAIEFKSGLGGFSLIAPKNDILGGNSPTSISFREKYGDEIFFYAIDSGNNLRIETIQKVSADTLENWLNNHFSLALETIENKKMVEVAGYQALQFDVTGALDGSLLYAGKGFNIDSVRNDFPPFPTFSYLLYTSNIEITKEITTSTRHIVIDAGNRFLLVSLDSWQSDKVIVGAENLLNTLKVFDTAQ
jgi:hypothetical protein